MAKAENNPAEEEKKGDQNAAEQPEKKGKSKLIVILAVAIVLLLVGVGALVFLLMGDGKDAEKTAAQPGEAATSLDEVIARQEKEEADKGAPPIYVQLDKFTANLKPDEGEADSTGVAVIEVALKVKNAEIEKSVKDRAPEIRHRILQLLNMRTAGQLEMPQEKDRLSDDIFIEANRVLNPELAGMVEFQVKSRGTSGSVGGQTGHDVQTDTSGVHESSGAAVNAPSSPSASIQDDTVLTQKLPIQRVLFTSFIVQRL